MSNKRELRLALRPGKSPLERLLVATDHVRELKKLAVRGIRYKREIDAANPKEPFAIANRRTELLAQAKSYDAWCARTGTKRAA